MATTSTSRVLINGGYGLIGNNSAAGLNLNIVEDFCFLLTLNHDGSPEGYQAAYMNAIENARNNMFLNIVQRITERYSGMMIKIRDREIAIESVSASLRSWSKMLDNVDDEQRTIGGIPARIQWMTVVKEWSE